MNVTPSRCRLGTTLPTGRDAMDPSTRLPPAAIVIIGEVVGSHYSNHRRVDALFAEAGFPGDPPNGSCAVKAQQWLRMANEDSQVDILGITGALLVDLMEADYPYDDKIDAKRKRVRDVLQKNGLTYLAGGRIAGGTFASPSRALADVLRGRDLKGLNQEFERAQQNIDRDPPASITAACAILEALFKIFLEDEGLPVPTKQTTGPLWHEVQNHLGLDPKSVEDVDLKKVLGGMTSVVDGIGAFRTHAGSAHGRGRPAYAPAARHARLVVHAAHSVAVFVLETWEFRKRRAS